tara:strand:+ start:119 stop:538 length:420 start_codon:yes stop_codon:yes gene_type:complete
MKKPSISELRALIEQGLENIPFPYVKGNSVRIGNMVVRTSKNGNFVFDMKCKKQIANTFSKTAAIAIAKNCAHGQTHIVDEVLRIDHEIEKNYNDAVFFQHSYKKSDDELRKEVLECRLEIATTKIDKNRSRLEDYIYN